MRALRDIHVGPAGWSYADWRGRVYPEGAGSKFDTLALVAEYFDTAEINSSFYHPPSPETAASWLRHESWNDARILQTLEELGVGLCDIDQPLFANSIKPAAEVTSSIGYIRLHGRNYQNWFREEADVVERYDYLYSRDELDPWVNRIKEVAQKAKQTFVITNNHARGQSLANAFEIMEIGR